MAAKTRRSSISRGEATKVDVGDRPGRESQPINRSIPLSPLRFRNLSPERGEGSEQVAPGDRERPRRPAPRHTAPLGDVVMVALERPTRGCRAPPRSRGVQPGSCR